MSVKIRYLRVYMLIGLVFFMIALYVRQDTLMLQEILSGQRKIKQDLIVTLSENISQGDSVQFQNAYLKRFPRHSVDNTTIVTAYFDLGTFKKGDGSLMFSTNTYFKWSASFRYLLNPLVVFTDSLAFSSLMKQHRKQMPNNTVIVVIKREMLWPFRLLSKIKSVFEQPGYPKHHPNTVVPEYSSAQHAKYAVVAEAVKRRYFDTKYYAWLDIGYFRDLGKNTKFFKLNAPSNLNTSKLAVNRVHARNMNVSYADIFRGNIVWVGGGMFIGTGNLVTQFEREYKKAVMFFLEKKLMNTDQQVLYSMYCNEGKRALKPNISLQTFIPKGKGNPWFYLGYKLREVTEKS